jgi:hypothetical protein
MMKRFRLLALSFLLVALPATAQAYIGLGLGGMNEDHFGFGVSFGAHLPANLGIDVQMLSYLDSVPGGDLIWLQASPDLMFDFNFLWKKVSEKIELHPYVKGGFTYGALYLHGTQVSGTKLSHGPGFNFGGGVDWKLFPFLTVGFDLTEHIVWLTGAKYQNIPFGQDQTLKAFNALVFLKFFAY